MNTNSKVPVANYELRRLDLSATCLLDGPRQVGGALDSVDESSRSARVEFREQCRGSAVQMVLPVCGILVVTSLAALSQPEPRPALERWHQRISPISNRLNDVVYGSGTFVAVGSQGAIVISTNGVCWTQVPSGTSDWLSGVTYANGIFVVVGGTNILTSGDGFIWSLQAAMDATMPRFFLSDIAFGNGLFVAVGMGSVETTNGLSSGSGIIMTSSNGCDWITQFNREGDFFNAVAYGGGQFIVGGGYGALLTSSDALLWTDLGPTPNDRLADDIVSVGYGKGRFVALRFLRTFGQVGVCGPRTYLWSPETDNDWRSGWGSGPRAQAVAFASGVFAAIVTTGGGGLCDAFVSTNVLISPDGITWTARPADTDFRAIRAMCYGNGTFVAVGEGGTILQSDPLVGLTLRLRNHPELTISGPPGSYGIESVDCLNATNRWERLTTISLSTVPYVWTDVQSTNSARRFYRAVLLP